MSKTCWVLSTYLARSVPEFPGTPWQEIKGNRRVELLDKIAITKHTPVAGLGFRDRGHPDDYFDAITKHETLGCIDENASFVLEFDFRETNTFIKAGFAIWLKSTRDALLTLNHSRYSPYWPTKKRKGKAGNTSVYWQALRDLGRLRRRNTGEATLASNQMDARKAGEQCMRAQELLNLFTEAARKQIIGFVESLLERPRKEKAKC